MTDTRRRDRRRSLIFTVKFHTEEIERLRAIADAHFRSPADQIRYWLATDTTTVPPVIADPSPDRVPE